MPPASIQLLVIIPPDNTRSVRNELKERAKKFQHLNFVSTRRRSLLAGGTEQEYFDCIISKSNWESPCIPSDHANQDHQDILPSSIIALSSLHFLSSSPSSFYGRLVTLSGATTYLAVVLQHLLAPTASRPVPRPHGIPRLIAGPERRRGRRRGIHPLAEKWFAPPARR